MQNQPRSFWRLKKCNIQQWPSQSPDLNPTEHAFHLLKTKLKAERPTNQQQLMSAAAKTWQSITNEETQSLAMSMGSHCLPAFYFSKLQSVIFCVQNLRNVYNKPVHYKTIFQTGFLACPDSTILTPKDGLRWCKLLVILVYHFSRFLFPVRLFIHLSWRMELRWSVWLHFGCCHIATPYILQKEKAKKVLRLMYYKWIKH